ncbi:MAG: hypothetical protein FWE67_15590, partial [Planctomycetaceae bacterium]|nr:hypothetical protein [Planctomycetaceae bacterium]
AEILTYPLRLARAKSAGVKYKPETKRSVANGTGHSAPLRSRLSLRAEICDFRFQKNVFS